MREDTSYWRWATQKNEYDPEMHGIFVPKNDHWVNSMATVIANNAFTPINQGMNFIMAGMGIRPVSSEAMFRAKHDKIGVSESRIRQLEQINNKFLSERQKYTDYIKTLPTHYEFLRDNIYGGVDEHDV